MKFWAELVEPGVRTRIREWDESGTLIRDEIYRNDKLQRARIKGYKL